VSSSGHTALLAWQRGWGYAQLDADARKRFEVALHAGAGAAMLVLARGELRATPPAVTLAACLPPALAGALLERPIERRLGTPASIAAGLLAGSAAMALGELRGGRGRALADARLRDGLALGAAQALALAPGVSRSGAARAVARWRGFSPAQARALSDAVGLPITLGAVAFKARELDRVDATLAIGAGAAFCSTLACARLVGRGGRLTGYAAYRAALAAAVIHRLRQNRKR
jgi:undecaprenyl-diphosphatase